MVINFSGHPTVASDVEVQLGSLPLEDSAKLEEAISAAIDGLPKKVIEASQIGRPITLILPGMSAACAVLLAAWHGRFGHFPAIWWAVRQEGAFVFTNRSRLDLQDVRHSARARR